MGRTDGVGAAGRPRPLKTGLLHPRRDAAAYGAQMRRFALTVMLAALAPTVASPAASAHGPQPRAAGPPQARQAVSMEDAAAQQREQWADAMVDRATEHMRRAATCRPEDSARPTTFTDAAPSEALRSRLSLLRRPRIPEDDVAPASIWWRLFPAEGVYRDWIRMGRAADGTEFYLVTAQRSGRQALPPTCLRRRRAQLLRLFGVVRADRRLRTLAFRSERRRNRAERQLAPGREQIFVFTRAAGNTFGFGFGGIDLATLEQRGLRTSGGSGGDGAWVTGLVPDGVATIDMVYAQRADRGPHAAPEIYESEETVVVPVQDNVFSYRTDRRLQDADATTMVWRAADGSVVRTIHERG
jgi:hypothetical protein